MGLILPGISLSAALKPVLMYLAFEGYKLKENVEIFSETHVFPNA